MSAIGIEAAGGRRRARTQAHRGFVTAPKPAPEEISRALAVLHDPDAVIELRAIYKGGRKRVDAGCFDGEHRDLLVKEAVRLNDDGAAVYVSLNEITPQLLARYSNRIQEYASATATDANVDRRRWLLVDIDPTRPKDTSATDDQLELAMQRARDVYKFLNEREWPASVVAGSGNGAHLLYRLDLPNDASSTDLVKRCLEALAARFDDSAIKIDRSVFNAARIIKLHGTIANKGDNVPSAPWRVSKLITVPDEIRAVSGDLLAALADEVSPASVRSTPALASSSPRAWTEDDMGAFLTRGNIEATGPDPHDGALRWKLKACPFNPDHGPGESAVFLLPDGKLGFDCRHNGCQDKHWRDLRTLVDGDRTASPRPPNGSNGASHSSEDPHVFATEPEPLRRPLPPAEPYPIDALGPILSAAVRRIHEVVQAPAALCGQSILAAASLAAQAHADVMIDGRRELLSLFAMTIAESGERKSAADRIALEAHRHIERSKLDEYKIHLQQHEIALTAHEAAGRAVSKGKDARAIRSALADLGPPPTAPLNPIFLVPTPTLEGIHKLYATGRPSIGLFHDDAGEFLGGHAMNADNRMKSAAGLSRLWDAGEFDRVRAGDGAQKYFGRRLSMHLMIQPVVAESVLSDDILTGQGLLARTLLAWPTSTIGHRPYAEIDLSTDADLGRYRSRIHALLEREATLRAGTNNELEPRHLTLTPEAKRIWVTVHDAIESDQRDAGTFASVRAWASKSPAQTLRIAGVLTLIEKPDAGVIDAETIERAATLTLHHLTEAVRIVGTSSVPAEIRHAEALRDWCHRDRITRLHSAPALQFGPASIRTAVAFNEAIQILERTGWAMRIEGGCEIDGALRRRAWTIRGIKP